MTNPSFMIWTERQAPSGFRYLWAKHVVGFDPSQHCAKCLRGRYETRFGLRAPVNTPVALDGYEPGDILYFCGVSAPYRHDNNMHLAVCVSSDEFASASVKLYNGDELTITGASRLEISDAAARSAFPALGRDFLTCRNFQFGAAFYAEELVG